MPVGAPSIQKIIDAWYSLSDRWIVRRNKALPSPQWELVHVWGGHVVSDDTQEVVSRFYGEAEAMEKARDMENIMRASKVRDMFIDWNI